MQQQQPSEQQSLEKDLRLGVNLFTVLVQAHAFCLTPFIRHSFGINQPGLTGVFSLILMILVMMESRDIQMFRLLEVWFLTLIGQRCWTFWQFCRGRHGHSYYNGHPWFAMLFVNNTETQAKALEPVLCLMIGFVLRGVSPTVGNFVMWGFASLTAVRLLQRAAMNRQVTAMQDLAIEQSLLSERMRGVRKNF
jgi:hypothetical protein